MSVECLMTVLEIHSRPLLPLFFEQESHVLNPGNVKVTWLCHGTGI